MPFLYISEGSVQKLSPKFRKMAISGKKTPKEGPVYLIDRLISDLVGTMGFCDASAVNLATDATYDCLGSVYALVGTKGESKELIGTCVSIGGGYLLAAMHSLDGYRRPYTSYGIRTSPGVGLVINEATLISRSELLELQIVDSDMFNNVDLVLLRVTSIHDSQKLKSARLPAFETSDLSSDLLSMINSFGKGALFVGFGSMSQTGISQKLQKNDISTFICNQDLAEQTISQLYTAHCDTPCMDYTNGKIVEKYEHCFLTMGSSQRHPHRNDSGGGLFVFYEGKVYLVGLHFKAIKFGNQNALTYPLFVNLLSVGTRVVNLIRKDRVSFLNRL